MDNVLDNVLGFARPATRRLAMAFIGLVAAAGLMTAIGGTVAERGVQAGSAEQVTTLAYIDPPSKRWSTTTGSTGGRTVSR